MPSGRTHDAITLIAAVPAGAIAFFLGAAPDAAVSLGCGVLVGGLLLSPDLDLKSRPYRRWGPLRWIWRPYQLLVPHRSSASHGLFLGPLWRLLYLSALFAGATAVAVALFNTYAHPVPWHAWLLQTGGSLSRLDGASEAWALGGLWVGSGLHGVADGVVTAWRRFWRVKRH